MSIDRQDWIITDCWPRIHERHSSILHRSFLPLKLCSCRGVVARRARLLSRRHVWRVRGLSGIVLLMMRPGLLDCHRRHNQILGEAYFSECLDSLISIGSGRGEKRNGRGVVKVWGGGGLASL